MPHQRRGQIVDNEALAPTGAQVQETPEEQEEESRAISGAGQAPITSATQSPERSERAVISSQDEEERTQTRQQRIEEIRRGIEEVQTGIDTIRERRAKEQEQRRQERQTEQEKEQAEADKKAQRDGTAPTEEGAQAEVDPAIQAWMNSLEQSDDEIDRLNEAMDEMQSRSDEITNSLIGNMRTQFEQRRQEMRDINKRARESIRTTGVRFGTERYSPLIATGIVAAEERAGMQRILEIDAQEQQFVLEARQAQAQNNMSMLSDRLEQAEKQRAEKQKFLKEQIERVQKNNEEMEAARTKANNEASIVSLVSQGITDPTEIFSQLNFDEEGNRINDISVESISDTLDSIIPEEQDARGLAGQWQDAKRIGAIPETMDFFTFVRRQAAAGRKPGGVGRGSEDASLAQAEQIARSVILSNPNDSPAELRNKIRAATDAAGTRLNETMIDDILKTPTSQLEAGGTVTTQTEFGEIGISTTAEMVGFTQDDLRTIRQSVQDPDITIEDVIVASNLSNEQAEFLRQNADNIRMGSPVQFEEGDQGLQRTGQGPSAQERANEKARQFKESEFSKEEATEIMFVKLYENFNSGDVPGDLDEVKAGVPKSRRDAAENALNQVYGDS